MNVSGCTCAECVGERRLGWRRAVAMVAIVVVLVLYVWALRQIGAPR